MGVRTVCVSALALQLNALRVTRQHLTAAAHRPTPTPTPTSTPRAAATPMPSRIERLHLTVRSRPTGQHKLQHS